MSQINVIVNKNKITPRSELLKNKFISKIKLKAKSTGYLFVKNTYFKIKPFEEFLKLLNEVKEISLKKSINTEMINYLVKFYEEQKIDEKKIKNVKDFAQINNDIIIPASSFKGAIRSRIEYKLEPYKIRDKYYSYSCFSVLGDVGGVISVNHKKFWGNNVLLNKRSCEYDEENPYVCIVCDMFGNPRLSSRYIFSDLKLIKGEIETLHEKFNIKAIKPNSEFEGEIIGFNSDYKELGILFAGLELFTNYPVLIGAYKYQHILKLNKTLFRNKHYFGTLRFEIINYEPKNIAKDVDDLLNKSKADLEKNEIRLNYEVGKIE